MEGMDQTVRCATDSFFPESSLTIQWRIGSDIAPDASTAQDVQVGDYNGLVLTSAYTFTANKADNGVTVTCSAVWNNVENGQRADRYLSVYCTYTYDILANIYESIN